MGIFSLSSIERIVLHNKYVKLGISHAEADKRIKNFETKLVKKRDLLKKQKLSDLDIDARLKEDFFNLRQSLDR